ncbi:hypothetical protein Q4603_18525 [Zobellia galactanivorans]|nr:hypothetical protein [Zobellia galactanivorans]
MIDLIKSTYPDSWFKEVNQEWIKEIESKYSELPKNLKTLYNQLGYGGIGPSHYAIHVLMEPEEIYDPLTAKELAGKLIVGDDFAGCCYAYDTQDNWQFGYIEHTGEFESLEGVYSDFIDFLRALATNEKE